MNQPKRQSANQPTTQHGEQEGNMRVCVCDWKCIEDVMDSDWVAAYSRSDRKVDFLETRQNGSAIWIRDVEID